MTPQEQIINDPRYTPLYDHGFVGLIETMGSDEAICQAARVSYGTGTKSVSDDRNLIRYLKRHRHCYHPNMQVLTIEGWKKWSDCKKAETFLIPDPETHSLSPETLEVKKFTNTELMHTFDNQRMSYSVTSDHKMWFKQKYAGEFGKVKVQEMSKWGWFEPSVEYSLFDRPRTYMLQDATVEYDSLFAFIGFYLGDGSYASTNRLSFHLKKDRKKDFLLKQVSDLGIPYTISQSSTYVDAKVFYIELFDEIQNWIDVTKRAEHKSFPLDRLQELTESQAMGLFLGLLHSDGNFASDRNQLRFATTSDSLANLFMTLSAYFGLDAHKTGNDITWTAYSKNGRTSLESRKQYHSTSVYSGDVYCATSSTGLLMVRGKNTEFGFVCGNTSPFEMAEVKLHLKMPIFIMRQWVRHRTANLNEYSARYSELSHEFYLPAENYIAPQSTTNNQGRAGTLSTENKLTIIDVMAIAIERSYQEYEALLGKHDDMRFSDDFEGVSRELARIVVPVANYTECFWKTDLHNLFHFLNLRMDAHAQQEIQDYANAVYELVKFHFPLSCEAFESYQLNAKTLSEMDQRALGDVLNDSFTDSAKHYGMSQREFAEFKDWIAGMRSNRT